LLCIPFLALNCSAYIQQYIEHGPINAPTEVLQDNTAPVFVIEPAVLPGTNNGDSSSSLLSKIDEDAATTAAASTDSISASVTSTTTADTPVSDTGNTSDAMLAAMKATLDRGAPGKANAIDEIGASPDTDSWGSLTFTSTLTPTTGNHD
ncbi:unnamed protein product, partial [Ectocarpus fasciculatus]